MIQILFPLLFSSLDSTLLGLDPGLLARLEAVTLQIDKEDEAGILDSGATLGVSLPIPSLGNESPVLSAMKDGAVGNKITTKRRLTPQPSESFVLGRGSMSGDGIKASMLAFSTLVEMFLEEMYSSKTAERDKVRSLYGTTQVW